MKYHPLVTFLIIIFLLLVLSVTSCASEGARTNATSGGTDLGSTPTHQSTPTPQSSTVTWGHTYIDAKLGFRLQIDDGLVAIPEPGLRSSAQVTAVSLVDLKKMVHQLIVIGVMKGIETPTSFAKRGLPTTHIGSYPAFTADRAGHEGRVPCVVRVLLVGTDSVVAEWCSMDAFTHTTQFERMLSTYQPAAAGFVSRPEPAPQPQTCEQVKQARGYSPTSQWGWQLGKATSRGWKGMAPGSYVCSNKQSVDPYLFQCTELANRFLFEQWGLPHLPGNAARYYDYYQDGVRHDGVIHDFPTASYQLSDDASQGKSAFRPVAGDLLIFQDVKDSRVGWTSGLTDEPGHVVVIAAVDASYVYIAQQNYNETQYFLALPITKVANGYTITDLSGWSNRIVRGWIHFTVNGGTMH